MALTKRALRTKEKERIQFIITLTTKMRILISILMVCVFANANAQTNFVKNGDFERYDSCPYQSDQLHYAKYWRSTVDSDFVEPGEYDNSCSNSYSDKSCHVPDNPGFFQYAHSGGGLIAMHLYYDKTLPRPPLESSFDYRDYAQTKLYKNLTIGKSYCISFWINKAESYCYAHNKIGAYLDDGSINSAVDSAGKEIISVMPQVYTNTIIKDTQNWIKIEGSFVAKGTESVITIGNFFPNSALDTTSSDCVPGGSPQYSYYLFDDVSVVALDLKADAGADRNVPLSKKSKIGRVGDSTATALDCKWYYKGKLIDSGVVITVNSGSSVGVVDTYVVVQTICGLVKTDTMLLRTVPTGFNEVKFNQSFIVVPNPSNGKLTIASVIPQGSVNAKVYDLLGRVIYSKQLEFSNNEAGIDLDVIGGIYLLEIRNSEGEVYRQRIEVRK